MMNKSFSNRSKLNIAIMILAMCSVVFFSNYRIKNLSYQVSESIESIYEDRLLAQDILFAYNSLLDKINLKLDSKTVLNEAKELKKSYLKTSLTREEKELIKDFSQHIEIALNRKNKFSNVDISKLKFQLLRLEAIQLEEAEIQMNIIKKARNGEELGFYLETAILILLLVIVQSLIFTNGYKKRIKVKNHRLN